MGSASGADIELSACPATVCQHLIQRAMIDSSSVQRGTVEDGNEQWKTMEGNT